MYRTRKVDTEKNFQLNIFSSLSFSKVDMFSKSLYDTLHHILRLLAVQQPQVVSKSVVVRVKRVFEKTKAVIVFSAKCWTKCPLSASIQKFIKIAYYEIFQQLTPIVRNFDCLDYFNSSYLVRSGQYLPRQGLHLLPGDVR